MTSERVAIAIAGVATIVWVASVIMDAVVRSYDPPATVHALMMAAAGWAFGQRYLRRAKNGKNDYE